MITSTSADGTITHNVDIQYMDSGQVVLKLSSSVAPATSTQAKRLSGSLQPVQQEVPAIAYSTSITVGAEDSNDAVADMSAEALQTMLQAAINSARAKAESILAGRALVASVLPNLT
jgi:hypothetical protein